MMNYGYFSEEFADFENMFNDFLEPNIEECSLPLITTDVNFASPQSNENVDSDISSTSTNVSNQSNSIFNPEEFLVSPSTNFDHIYVNSSLQPSPLHESDSGVSESESVSVASSPPPQERNIYQYRSKCIENCTPEGNTRNFKNVLNCDSKCCLDDKVVDLDAKKGTSFRSISAEYDSDDSSQSSSSLKKVSSENKLHGLKIITVKKPCNLVSNDSISEQVIKAIDDRSKKNAQQAKLNREKKKAYIKNLENEMEVLKNQNHQMKQEIADLKTNMSNLEEESAYLKSVLMNASPLSSLLNKIGNVPVVNLSTRFTRKRLLDNIPVSGEPTVEAPCKKEKKAGVCLHVNGDEFSLEFCAHCSSQAHST
ncbi:cyclic AMP-responsive element-binding protein 3-like protein 3-A [Physella acuta]|uniref:cyclic AMP-responsive element-binding protein 3-like protein 3-A n=1 Tax=Physella acuta TaxID=109671 RepID=UPI0027DD34EC|nr:cyclic AMP-responsive element-binding protein 3-like protein 3-A [Physella acuta]